MITEGDAVIPLEKTLHAFRNQEKTKQRSTIRVKTYILGAVHRLRTQDFEDFSPPSRPP